MIVIDTHVLIWLALSPEKLSEKANQTISTAAEESTPLMIADITLWETAMLVKKGRLELPVDIDTFLNLSIQAYNLQVEPITPRIASLATKLPAIINKDPADRLIVATAMTNEAPLMTADRNLRSAPDLQTIW